MPKTIERIFLVLSDLFAINLTFFIWIGIRENSGYSVHLPFTEFLILSSLIYFYWLLLFLFFGLYRSWYAQSRFDEFVALLKTISIGVLIIFLVTLDLHQDIKNPFPISRVLIVSYWFIMLIVMSSGRMLLRTIQRKFLERGVGLRNTIIIGYGAKAKELYQKVKQFPALGYRVIGFIAANSNKDNTISVVDKKLLGGLSNLEEIVVKNKVEDVLIALEDDERNKVVDVIGISNGLPVHFKIVPDLYDIVVGQARTNQIYGFPLIEILPELMPAWERRMKRLIDVLFSAFILMVFAPLWFLVAAAIKINSRGPVFYNQIRVGRNGKLFKVHKFRSMHRDAEMATGPVWADKNDPRITRVGRVIRKLRIDEIPQFINVLKGEMSLIGPRPERPYFVEQLKKELPYYSRRLRVRPGITGWAQIKHEYDQSLDDVRKKIQYDLFYLENMSLRLDLKIILNTLYTMLLGKGH